MKQNQTWLEEELPKWVKEGILEPSAAEKLKSRYAGALGKEPSLSGLAVVSIVCAIVGLGLLAAGCWNGLAQSERFWLAAGPLLVSFPALAFCLWRGGKTAPLLREGAGLFHGLALVAAVWMVHDSYMLSHDLHDLSLWAAVFLLVPLYLIRSAGLGLIYTALAASAAGLAPFRGWPDMVSGLLLAAELPYLLLMMQTQRERSVLLIAWVWAAGIFYLTYCSVDSTVWQILLFSVIASLTWLAGAAFRLWKRTETTFRLFGCLAVFAVLLRASFGYVWEGSLDSWLLWAVMVILLAAEAFLIRQSIRKKQYLPALGGAAPFVLVLAAGMGSWDETGALPAMTASFFCAMLALAVIVQGFQKDVAVQRHAGLILLAAAGAARIFDSSLSYGERGWFFLFCAVAAAAAWACFRLISRRSRSMMKQREAGHE